MDYTNGLLDELTATKVMGWHKADAFNEASAPFLVWRDKAEMFEHTENEWNPSVNIEQAMQVLEKMIADGYKETAMVYEREGWIVEFYKEDVFDDVGNDARDKSLPRAICLAALKAKENVK
jgi:hypothetical protein